MVDSQRIDVDESFFNEKSKGGRPKGEDQSYGTRMNQLARELDINLRAATKQEKTPGIPRQARREDTRTALLDERVPSRVCPSCKQSKTSSRQWVLFNLDQASGIELSAEVKKVGAICRACAMRTGLM